MRLLFALLLFFVFTSLSAQTIEGQLIQLEEQLLMIKTQEKEVLQTIEERKLERIRRDLIAIGLPSDDYIEHSALFLNYSEAHEQAAWVAHIITPEIIDGKVMRSNDFREDPKVATGTAVEADYFLKELRADSTYKYDGFGYDRGHLAPSADFRWSQLALSESYFYSNMSPQKADFNRGGWAALESFLRTYINSHPTTQLYVVTLPLYGDEPPPVIERGINKVSIPQDYMKVAIDLQAKKGIAFIMPNTKIPYPTSSYAISIDEAEERAGYDFFKLLEPSLQEQIEGELDKEHWFKALQGGDSDPIHPPSLPPAHFNTVQAKIYAGKGKEIKVCGKVVSTRRSRSGNVWLNLDKSFPNQIFSVYIKKEHLSNFSYAPEDELDNKILCFKGKIQLFSGTPTMRIEKEEDISLLPSTN